jgi:heme-degrading monooxygenase HmoA
MILRMWKGQSSFEKAGEYVKHATKTVFPKLRKIEGHRGAYLLRRQINGGIEFVVLTLWDSMEAVHRFAGEDADEAVVEPEAQSALSGFDDFVTHFDVLHGISKATD